MPRPASIFFAAAFGFAAAPALSADIRVDVEGLRDRSGQVMVAVCPENLFTKAGCPWTGTAPAGQTVTVTGVPPGTYAVQAIHDENGNGDLDRGLILPKEGIGFSRDAPMRRGPPRFADAAVIVTAAGGQLKLTMRYFQ